MSRLAHGLAGGLVARDWPALSAEELAPVLARYSGAGAVAEVAWHSERPFAASGIVRTQRGLVFVKRHDARVRSVAGLTEEHAFIGHLRRRGAPVPAVLAADDGGTATACAEGTYEVHALARGEDRYRDAHSWTPVRGEADAAALGRALARLHVAAEGFAAPARRTRLLVAGDALLRQPDLVEAVEGRLGQDALLRAALAGRPWRRDVRAALSGWHRVLRPHWPAMPPLWAHGDFHASNTLWDGAGVASVLDFGLCNAASALFDLATAIERNAVAWLQLEDGDDIGRPALARALVAGYAAERPLTHADRDALRRVLPLVHVDFALSELAYFHGVTGSTRDADAAYAAFLLGHAGWFGGVRGAAFLKEGLLF